jgi:hypothetical protein
MGVLKLGVSVLNSNSALYQQISKSAAFPLNNYVLNFLLDPTNASTESFNAKIKAFRASFRGVRNISFFLFRLANIFA